MDKENKKTISFANIAIIGAQVLLIFLSWNKLPPEIPLLYSQPWGTDQLAPGFMILLLPLLSFFVLAVNLSLSKIFKDKLVSKLFSFTGLIFSIFCLIGAVKIVRLVL